MCAKLSICQIMYPFDVEPYRRNTHLYIVPMLYLHLTSYMSLCNIY